MILLFQSDKQNNIPDDISKFYWNGLKYYIVADISGWYVTRSLLNSRDCNI